MNRCNYTFQPSCWDYTIIKAKMEERIQTTGLSLHILLGIVSSPGDLLNCNSCIALFLSSYDIGSLIKWFAVSNWKTCPRFRHSLKKWTSCSLLLGSWLYKLLNSRCHSWSTSSVVLTTPSSVFTYFVSLGRRSYRYSQLLKYAGHGSPQNAIVSMGL